MTTSREQPFDPWEYEFVDVSTPARIIALLCAFTGLSDADFATLPQGEWRYERRMLADHAFFFLDVPSCTAALIDVDLRTGRFRVGTPVGYWPTPGTLAYRTGRPYVELGPDDADVGSRMRSTIEASMRSRQRSIRTCQHCGKRAEPEFMLSDDCCYGCGSTVFDIVY